jgi:putative DNA primase/helicase
MIPRVGALAVKRALCPTLFEYGWARIHDGGAAQSDTGAAIPGKGATVGATTTDHTKPIAIVARGSSADERGFLLLRISEPGAEPREEILSIDDYGARKKETISRLQLPIVAAAAKNQFDVRVQDAVNSLPDTFDVATRGGWFRGAFVFPNGEIVAPAGTLPSRKIRACLPTTADKYRVRGTLAGWQELCRLAEGNTSLMLSLALAFVGPLGELMGGDPPMFQLVGAAESGKSSVAIAAGSVWGEYDEGRRRSYVETWNNTGNNLEAIAAAHFGTFLVLDETGLADQSKSDNPYPVIKKTVLQLFQGEMKGRLTQARKLKWWMDVLSTSNKSLDEMAVDSRTQCPETVRTRLIDVPVPLIAHGAYEELHGFADEQALSVELKRIAAAHYGLAAREFVKDIVAWHNESPTGAKRWLAARREHYRK